MYKIAQCLPKIDIVGCSIFRIFFVIAFELFILAHATNDEKTILQNGTILPKHMAPTPPQELPELLSTRDSNQGFVLGVYSRTLPEGRKIATRRYRFEIRVFLFLRLMSRQEPYPERLVLNAPATRLSPILLSVQLWPREGQELILSILTKTPQVYIQVTYE